MQLVSIAPLPEIAPWVHHFWVFTSAHGLPSGDARVVVPNGRHKLIVPFRNGLTAAGAGKQQHHAQGEIAIIGLWDKPTVISSTAEDTCTIGVEFPAHALSRLFGGDAQELTDRIANIDDYLGRAGGELRARVSSSVNVVEAVQHVQTFLAERLHAARPPSPGAELVQAAVDVVLRSRGSLAVADLERRMGYSRRYLQALFERHVGLSPKRLIGVVAFERLYRRFSESRSAELLREDALDLFYDQSHFIRTFRRFTGFSPGRFAALDNEFGRIFYRPTPVVPIRTIPEPMVLRKSFP